jgi:UDP-N-acetylmuramyl pentapeptide synthase
MNYLKENIDRREKNFKMINEQINSNPDLLKINVKGLTKISNFGIP